MRGQSLAHSENSFRVLELFRPPMTSIASTREARSCASLWRRTVVLQMLSKISHPGMRRRAAAQTASKRALGVVVWATTSARGISGSARASSSVPTT